MSSVPSFQELNDATNEEFLHGILNVFHQMQEKIKILSGNFYGQLDVIGKRLFNPSKWTLHEV